MSEAIAAAWISCLLCLTSASAQSVFINELHYDNTGADSGEAVEIVAPAGTDLSAYELVFYNGSNGEVYKEVVLSGIVPNEGGSGYGAVAFSVEAIQNGSPDGLVLYHTATGLVVQFLSYEGSMTAVGGVADGQMSEDIGVVESGATAEGNSLQRTGSGTEFSDFSWKPSAAASSFGALNLGQELQGSSSEAILNLTLSKKRLVESDRAALEARVMLSAPPQGEDVTLTIELSETDSVTAPTEVTIDGSGTATFSVFAVDNDFDEGDRTVRLVVSDTVSGLVASADLVVVDDDRMAIKGEAVRVATFNLLNGVGGRDGVAYDAVASSLSRVEPDVIAFQEVDSADGFAALRTLLEDLAFESDPMYLATVDDAFALAPYDGGAFNSGEQSLAIASRYPLKRVVQIGREKSDDRREITRYPLYVEIDVPWADDADDLHVVCVHYKAGTRAVDRFRRAIEAYRTLEFLEGEGISAATHNVIVSGDFNENIGNFQPNSINTGRMTFADGSTLPDGFLLGDDISGENAITIPYDAFPAKLFGESSFSVASPRHADRKAVNTFIVADDVRLDYIVSSDRLHSNGNRFSEVFNSRADVDFEGLPKQGKPLEERVSVLASDHYPVFGDYWLKPVDKITVSFSTAAPSLDESEDATVKASIVLTPAPADGEVITVMLSDFTNDLAMPSSVTIEGPNTSAFFEVGAAGDGRADRSRSVALVAEADGYATGYGNVFVRNANASGVLLFSQVMLMDQPGASSAVALEIVNASTAPISFADTPVQVRIYSDGATDPTATIDVQTGSVAPGKVVVIGNDALRTLVPELEYIEVNFEFDGGAALELMLDGIRSDVFGRIGDVTNAPENLALKSTIGIGSKGWGDSSLRFEAEVDGVTELGVPPALDDPYVAWIEAFGLNRNAGGHPDADLDEDLLTNAGEFGFFTNPTIPDRDAPTADNATRHPVFLRRPDDGRVLYRLRSSANLIDWNTEPFAALDVEVVADGRERLTAAPLSKILRFTHYFRLTAELP